MNIHEAQRLFDNRQPPDDEERPVVDWKVVYVIEGVEEEDERSH